MVKASDLLGPALDWAVEFANGTHWSANSYFVFRYEGCGPNGHFDKNPQWNYYTDWSQGGPIIEREGIQLHVEEDRSQWIASRWGYDRPQYGPTPLIAAMRCYVASKLGDEIDVPKEFL